MILIKRNQLLHFFSLVPTRPAFLFICGLFIIILDHSILAVWNGNSVRPSTGSGDAYVAAVDIVSMWSETSGFFLKKFLDCFLPKFVFGPIGINPRLSRIVEARGGFTTTGNQSRSIGNIMKKLCPLGEWR